jgi:predicted dehydrogenase
MIGCGAVTERKSAPAYSQVSGSKLVAVAARRSSAAKAYAERQGIQLVFDDIGELIRSAEVDAVYIATPPSSHLALALQVADAGKPCCVEKPLAMSYTEAVRMVKAFEAAGQPLFVAYYRRSLPRFTQVKRWIDAGEIGDIRHIHWSLARTPSLSDLSGDANWRTDVKEAPGGYFEDLACHGLDLFDYFAGPICEASGVSRNQQELYGVPDTVAASWAHAGGATGSAFWNFGAFQQTDEVAITGAKGGIRFAVFDEAPVVLETISDPQALDIPNPDPIQLHHVEDMIQHLAGTSTHPSTGESAARTEWVMDQILGKRRG